MGVVVAAVAAISVECHAAGFLVPEWAQAARVGAALTGTAAGLRIVTGVAAIGAVGTGAVVSGARVIGTATGKIRTASGVGGTATSGVIPGRTWCSSGILASRGGGAGVGALGQAAGDIPMDITATVILTTVAVTVIPITDTVTDTATDTAMDTVPNISLSTAVAPNPESPSCSADFHALVIIADPSTEFWDRKRVAQSVRTSRITAT